MIQSGNCRGLIEKTNKMSNILDFSLFPYILHVKIIWHSLCIIYRHAENFENVTSFNIKDKIHEI